MEHTGATLAIDEVHPNSPSSSLDCSATGLPACKDATARLSLAWFVRERFPCVHHFSVAEDQLSVSPGSGGLEVLAYFRWYLHVSLLLMTSVPSKRIQTIIPTGSWEFVTNLDYEWSFIRGRQPYRWAMWVRDDSLTLNLL
jgi:hypothetical protein